MRRTTRSIVTPLLTAAAVSILTGCRPKQMQRCVDEHDNVVDDKLCDAQPGGAQTVVRQRPDGHGGFVPIIIPMYRNYYGGAGSYGVGSHVYGGAYQPQQDQNYRTSSGGGYHGGGGFFHGITRGGFGSHFGGGGS